MELGSNQSGSESNSTMTTSGLSENSRFSSVQVPLRTDILKLFPPPRKFPKTFDLDLELRIKKEEDQDYDEGAREEGLESGSDNKRKINNNNSSRSKNKESKNERRTNVQNKSVDRSSKSSNNLSHQTLASSSTKKSSQKRRKAREPNESRSKKTKSVRKKKRRERDLSEEEESENEEDEDDLELSDYSEPETKLRGTEKSMRDKKLKFAALKRARKQKIKNDLLKSQLLSRRIVADSDEEKAIDEQLRQQDGCTSSDGGLSEEESEESDETETGSSCSSGESEFIVEDSNTPAEKLRIQREMRKILPAQFLTKKDNSEHFRVVCDYLIHCLILPQVNWRKKVSEFDESCVALDNFFHGRPVQLLESQGWSIRFRSEIKSRPYCNFVRSECSNQKSGCAACNRRDKAGLYTFRLYGSKYDPKTLRPIFEKVEVSSSSDYDDDESGIESFSDGDEDVGGKDRVKLDSTHIKSSLDSTSFVVGRICGERAEHYHYFKHWQMHIKKELLNHLRRLKNNESSKNINSHSNKGGGRMDFSLRFQTLEDPVPRMKDMKRKFKPEIKMMCDAIDEHRISNLIYESVLRRIDSVEKNYT